jgi:hypothetical protein
VFLPVNIPACTVQHIIETVTLAARHSAIGLCIPLRNPDPRLAGSEPGGFPARQLLAANPLTNPLLLMTLAPVYVRRVRHHDCAETDHE